VRGADHKVPRGTGGLGKGVTSGGTRRGRLGAAGARRSTQAVQHTGGASLALEHFSVPMFDGVFLKSFQLKCAE
jgi:hypothetical protein